MLSVFLYVPNLIGYARCILMILAFIDWTAWKKFLALYFTSFVLDAADGYAARQFDQSSEIGALLDMLTDRCGTATLLCVLCLLYPPFASVFLALNFLDGFSHWVQMSSGLYSGTSSHKQAGHHSQLIRLYYKRAVLTIVCLFNEVFFLLLYVLHFWHGPTLFMMGSTTVRLLDVCTWVVCLPIVLVKQLVNVQQVVAAHHTLLHAV